MPSPDFWIAEVKRHTYSDFYRSPRRKQIMSTPTPFSAEHWHAACQVAKYEWSRVGDSFVAEILTRSLSILKTTSRNACFHLYTFPLFDRRNSSCPDTINYRLFCSFFLFLSTRPILVDVRASMASRSIRLGTGLSANSTPHQSPLSPTKATGSVTSLHSLTLRLPLSPLSCPYACIVL